MALFSIGHSNASIRDFLELLRRHKIAVLVDARSQPYSRYNPHFRWKALKHSLEENGIKYLFLGDRIGGKPADKRFLLENGKVDYEQLASAAFYLEGIDRLMETAHAADVCFMCAEADFRNCHRYWLITRTLAERGIEVKHILHSGELGMTDLSDFQPQQPRLF